MPRIKIEDLPVLEDLTPKETKGIFGGESTSELLSQELTHVYQQSSDTTDTEGDTLEIYDWSHEVVSPRDAS